MVTRAVYWLDSSRLAETVSLDHGVLSESSLTVLAQGENEERKALNRFLGVRVGATTTLVLLLGGIAAALPLRTTTSAPSTEGGCRG